MFDDESMKVPTFSLSLCNDLTIENIFAVRCLAEDSYFRADIEPKQLLFHASRVENYVGILSRGLLLPKVVVDDYGGSRTDAGNLGQGIYFASAARLQCLNFDLTEPPHGYQSVHGVKNSIDMPSQFKDDEYVCLQQDQQRIRYWWNSDSEMMNIHIMNYSDISICEIITDISDVQDVLNPLSKIEAGLIAGDGKSVSLSQVHIAAHLVDLAAEVTVFQTYRNDSSESLEAKFVFPLDDMAAVSGFEIYINGKHIVGEVKEKEKAHKEYREAIQQGHGAYLMDQDEETPDVFTVSVGNVPGHAAVW
ncbi:hypothetical protein ScPMuIL_012706 [Solemya velum]